MHQILYTLPLLAPILLSVAGLIALADQGVRPKRALAASRYASVLAFIVSLTSITTLITLGEGDGGLIGAGPVSFAIRLDPLSASLAALVTFVGIIVLQFSRNYLDGEDRQATFFGWMCLTLAAVTTLVISGTLLMLALAWIATSLCLHHLLVYYKDRPGAQLAARKKFLVARIGDVALITALLLIGGSLGTWQISAIDTQLSAGAPTLPLGIAAACIALAAILKSAQFPSHGWLIEVMETPTPVSALLHAGIVNAGGFLIIRFADVMTLFPAVLTALIFIGGATALIASAVMLTQNSIKTNLAWSTVAQMGFMILQCGFGAYSAALLHIIAHSFYKAHAFLSSGSAIDKIRQPETGKAFGPTEFTRLVGGSVLGLWIFAAAAQQMSFGLTSEPGFAIFGAVIVLGLAHYLTRALTARSIGYVMISVVVTSIVASALYFGLQAGFKAMLADSVPEAPEANIVGLGLMYVLLAGFAGLTLLQNLPAHLLDRPFARRWRTHLSNGLYANALFNRLVGSAFGPAQSRKGA